MLSTTGTTFNNNDNKSGSVNIYLACFYLWLQINFLSPTNLSGNEVLLQEQQDAHRGSQVEKIAPKKHSFLFFFTPVFFAHQPAMLQS